MNENLMLDVGLANELKLAFRRADFTPEDIKYLTEGDILTDVHNVVRGYAQIKSLEHIINLNAKPCLFQELPRVKNHHRGGMFKWSPDAVRLRPPQGLNGEISGHKLYEELSDQNLINANLLDHFLDHPRLIPKKEWGLEKQGFTRRVFFFGTVYFDMNRVACVRYLYSSERIARSSYRSLDLMWSEYDFVLVR